MTFNSATFPLPDTSSLTLYPTSEDVDAITVQIGPPEVLVETEDRNATFMALMAYNDTSSKQVSEKGGATSEGTSIRWCWLQTDLEAKRPTKYQQNSQIYLANRTSPVVLYQGPSVENGATVNVTVQVWEQTPELIAYLGDLNTRKEGSDDAQEQAQRSGFLLKASELLVSSPEVLDNASLTSVARTTFYFTVISSANTSIAWTPGSDLGGTETGQSDNSQRMIEDGTNDGDKFGFAGKQSIYTLVVLVAAVLLV